jgi:hypothetical protein
MRSRPPGFSACGAAGFHLSPDSSAKSRKSLSDQPDYTTAHLKGILKHDVLAFWCQSCQCKYQQNAVSLQTCRFTLFLVILTLLLVLTVFGIPCLLTFLLAAVRISSFACRLTHRSCTARLACNTHFPIVLLINPYRGQAPMCLHIIHMFHYVEQISVQRTITKVHVTAPESSWPASGSAALQGNTV